ncbi:methyltransferase domain-containing protein [Bacillus sp. C1]
MSNTLHFYFLKSFYTIDSLFPIVFQNATQLQFSDESFDVVSLNFILRVIEHPKQALSEPIRVTK